MSEKVDRKVQEVRVAEFLYRHEAEFAAGFLEDADIPYRLQADDAGGAELGMTISRPATLWVRAVDVDRARDLLAFDEEREPAAVAVPMSPHPRPETREPRLTPLERGVSAGLAVATLSAVPYIPVGPWRSYLGLLCLAGGLAFVIATAVGRTLGPFERVVRMVAGSPPR